APLLFLMHARYHVDTIAGWLASFGTPEQIKSALAAGFVAIALLGAAVLLVLALQPWSALGSGSTGRRETDATAPGSAAA
ncbi:MAG TPA: hypothetical protein VJO99_05795, partial [Burkholderiaceae bacterium]|nr:hypothetical protein [Burkholderiaceae bacterium]